MNGELEFISGCMFAGKTEELLKRIRIHKIAQRKVQLFKPTLDDRYDKSKVISHNKTRLKANLVKDTAGMIELLDEDVEVIGIDEIQFFDEPVIDFCIEQVFRGVKVIVAGLRQDFRAEPFKFRFSEKKHIGELLAYANVTSLKAVCTYQVDKGKICGEDAEYHQRLINGKPAEYDSPLILVGSTDSYAARCQQHFIRPLFKIPQKALNGNGAAIKL